MSNPVALTLPPEPLIVIAALQKAGYEAFLVGGSVRDILLRQIDPDGLSHNPYLSDYDITTNAKPEEIQKVFPESFYENTFGTVSLTYDDIWQTYHFPDKYQVELGQELQKLQQPLSPKIIDLQKARKLHVSLAAPEANASDETTATQLAHKTLPNIEITTYRCGEVYGADHRKPTALCWGATLQEDLSRRDFTVNAMAVGFGQQVLDQVVANISSLNPANLPSYTDYDLIDQHQGYADLQNFVIRTVGDPHQRFHEDALRMLRAIRLAVQLNFKLTHNILEAIKSHASLLTHISGERIRDEFLKMLVSNYPKAAIEMLDETGLLSYILPELLPAKGVKQGGHHVSDVWTHSLDALDNCPSLDPIVRLAALIHDIDKPISYKEINGQPTFYNHEVTGARTAVQIAKRLKLSSRDCERIFILVRYHMFHYQAFNSDAAIRRFMRKVGLENIDDILDLREADRLGSGAAQTSWRLEEMKARMVEQLNQPLDLSDLAINGSDLMMALNLSPGPQIGKILHALFELVLEKPELNNKEQLLAQAKLIVKQN